MIDLTQVNLFDDLTTIRYEGGHFDLHNDYDCSEISYDSDSKVLKLHFTYFASSIIQPSLELIFEGAIIANLKIFPARVRESSIIGLINRCRFEVNGKLEEYSPSGESYFNFEFENGDAFELFAKKVYLTVLTGK